MVLLFCILSFLFLSLSICLSLSLSNFLTHTLSLSLSLSLSPSLFLPLYPISSPSPLLPRQCLSKGSAGSDLKLIKTEDQGAAVTPGMEEQEDATPQLSAGRLQWFLMLDYRYM